MINYLSITSRSQGQIFGAKPSMEEFERQLEADGSIRIYNNLCAVLAAFAGAVQALKRTTGRSHSRFTDTIRPTDQRPAH